jgi:hypothetical protein
VLMGEISGGLSYELQETKGSPQPMAMPAMAPGESESPPLVVFPPPLVVVSPLLLLLLLAGLRDN